jgi:hypothetical protein
MVRVLLAIGLLCVCCLAAEGAEGITFRQDGPLGVIQLLDGAIAPDAAVDARGVVHIVYGLGDNACYVRSADNGRTFSAPVQVNSAGLVQLTMGERGPKLALGKDGSLHVVWADRWSPGVETHIRYSRSLDGGRSFEPARLVPSPQGIDGLTLAADPDGDVLIFWHVFDPPQHEVPDGHYLYMARSSDNGATFGPAKRLKTPGIEGLACSMCMMRARIGADGDAYLVFRTAQDNIRDFYVLRGPKGQDAFTPIRVNHDDWLLMRCPMCGPELNFDASGRAVCAFMSKHRVYWSVLDPGADAFRLHVSTPQPQEDEIYPDAVMNGKGEVLMVWQVGPMAVDKTAEVKWAVYAGDGRPTGEQGDLGTSTSGTKATAFVGADGRFYVVTTAKG